MAVDPEPAASDVKRIMLPGVMPGVSPVVLVPSQSPAVLRKEEQSTSLPGVGGNMDGPDREGAVGDVCCANPGEARKDRLSGLAYVVLAWFVLTLEDNGGWIDDRQGGCCVSLRSDGVYALLIGKEF